MIHIRALCYASRHLTDGFVPNAVLPTLLAGLEAFAIERIPAKEFDWPAHLVRHGLWEEVMASMAPAIAIGWQLHDFLEYNPSKSSIEKLRKAKAKAGRKGANAR